MTTASSAPRLGEHKPPLRRPLGYDEDDSALLVAQGVIGDIAALVAPEAVRAALLRFHLLALCAHGAVTLEPDFNFKRVLGIATGAPQPNRAAHGDAASERP